MANSHGIYPGECAYVFFEMNLRGMYLLLITFIMMQLRDHHKLWVVHPLRMTSFLKRYETKLLRWKPRMLPLPLLRTTDKAQRVMLRWVVPQGEEKSRYVLIAPLRILKAREIVKCVVYLCSQ